LHFDSDLIYAFFWRRSSVIISKNKTNGVFAGPYEQYLAVAYLLNDALFKALDLISNSGF